MKQHTKLIKSAFVILTLVLGGCASTAFKGDVETLSPDQATVIGKVEVVKDGEPHKLNVLGMSGFSLWVSGANDAQVVNYGIKDPGVFFWNLQPGEYLILGFAGAGLGEGALRVNFTVPPKAKILYIGDLLLSSRGGYYSYALKDNFASGVEAFRVKFPNTQIVPERAIARIEQTGTFEQTTGICGTEWGIECTRSNVGVEPIYPELPRNATVDSLTPILKWTPSSQAGVTYDVVVYEEQKIPRNFLGVIEDSLPGRRVHYTQGLTQPTLKLRSSLQPGRTYFWSVRLRRGETVSTWSTFGFFDFFIVGWTSGYGQWFTFSTPGK